MKQTSVGGGVSYLGDCRDVLAGVGDNSVDMFLTSPPYDNLRDYGGDVEWSWGVFEGVSKLISSKLAEGGVVVWVVSDATINGSETGTSFKQALHFKEVCGLNLHDTMIWEKSTFSAVGALKTRYAPVFEYMFILSKGKPKTFNPIKDRPNKWAGATHHGTVRQKDGSTKPVCGIKSGKVIAEFGQRFNVWRVNEEKSLNKEHPAVFPLQLAKDHIQSWSTAGDLVVDPFSGSATTLVAAESLGRKWIGAEVNQQYYEFGLSRLKAQPSGR